MRLLAGATLSLVLASAALGGVTRNVDLLHAFSVQLPKVKRAKGVLYSWQAKDLRSPEKAILTRMANQAIAAGPR